MVNGTQLDVCFQASPGCAPSDCDPAPAGCSYSLAVSAPLIRMINGDCCPEPCVAINVTSGKKCADKLSVPWEEAVLRNGSIGNMDGHDVVVVLVNTTKVHVCSEPSAECSDDTPAQCPIAPEGCTYLNASTFVKHTDGKCCPLGCVAVMADHLSLQCTVAPATTTAESHVIGAPCSVPSDVCPVARCAYFPGCVLDHNPPYVYDEEGNCCKERLCPYIQDADAPSGDTCEHDPSHTTVRPTTKASSTASSSSAAAAVTTTAHDGGSGDDTLDKRPRPTDIDINPLPTDAINDTDASSHANKQDSKGALNSARGVVVTVFVTLLTLVVVIAGVWCVLEKRRDGQGCVTLMSLS
jgi:hypothetical protein